MRPYPVDNTPSALTRAPWIGRRRKRRGRESSGSFSNTAAISDGFIVERTSRREAYFLPSSSAVSVVSRAKVLCSFIGAFLLFRKIHNTGSRHMRPQYSVFRERREKKALSYPSARPGGSVSNRIEKPSRSGSRPDISPRL